MRIIHCEELRPSSGTVLPSSCICKSIMQRATPRHIDWENAWMWHYLASRFFDNGDDDDCMRCTLWGMINDSSLLWCPLSSFFYLNPCPQYFSSPYLHLIGPFIFLSISSSSFSCKCVLLFSDLSIHCYPQFTFYSFAPLSTYYVIMHLGSLIQ